MDRVTVKIVADGHDQEKLTSLSEDLAWEAATAAAQVEGIDIGSDDFIAAFNILKKRYAECAQAYGHLRYTATSVLRGLMNSGMAVIYPKGQCSCDEHMREQFDHLVGVIFSTMTSVYCVGPAGWIPNDEWERIPEEQRTLYFEVMKTDILSEEEDDFDND